VHKEDGSQWAEIRSFPEGQVVKEGIQIGDARLRTSTDPNFLLLGFSSKREYPAAVVDLAQNKGVLQLKTYATDLWNGEFAIERKDGQITIHDIASNQAKVDIKLPDSPLGSLQTVGVSADFDWIALSDHTRGGVWNLSTGQRTYHLRGFDGAAFASGYFHADVPKYEQTPHSIAHLSLKGTDVLSNELKGEELVEQHGPVLLLMRGDSKSKTKLSESGSGIRWNLRAMKSLEARDVASQKVLWSRDFPKPPEDMYAHSGNDSLVFETATKESVSLEFCQLSTGKPIATLTLKTNKGSFYLNDAVTAGDHLVVGDSEGRVRIYTRTGQEVARVFGSDPVAGLSSGVIAVFSEDRDVIIYDLASGRKRQTLQMPHSPVYYTFDHSGEKLLVLTDDQSVYTFDVQKMNSDPTAKGN
jgi:hypothetical protein